jgi:hypothetical protein
MSIILSGYLERYHFSSISNDLILIEMHNKYQRTNERSNFDDGNVRFHNP